MALDHLENTFFSFGKGGILGVDLGSVCDGQLLGHILQDVNCIEVDLLLVHMDDGSNRLRHQGDEGGHLGTFEFDVHWNSNSV